MQTSLEDISPVKKKLSVEIESSKVDKKLDKAYRELQKTMKIHGFRQGKVPRKILETRFGEQVTKDIILDLINETFPKAVDEVKVFPVGEPVFEKGTLIQGQNFNYSAIMEIRPEFEINNYLGIEVEKGKVVVTEEMVQARLDKIREANGKLIDLDNKDKPIQKGDYAVLDYEASSDGESIEGLNTKNFLLNVGSKEFHPKFDEALIGHKMGDEIEIEADFEDSYPNARLAGKNVHFKVKIVEIKKMVLPELDDDFAKTLGGNFENIEALKNKVREALTTEEEERIDREVKQKLLQKISEPIDFELPQSLVESELAYAIENIRQNLMMSGSDLQEQDIPEEDLRKRLRPSSEKRVKEMLILGAIARQEGIDLTEEEIREGFNKIARMTGQDVETVRKYYELRNKTGAFREQLMEEKTLNYLVAHAKISEIS